MPGPGPDLHPRDQGLTGSETPDFVLTDYLGEVISEAGRTKPAIVVSARRAKRSRQLFLHTAVSGRDPPTHGADQALTPSCLAQTRSVASRRKPVGR
jgi:hypothetical protein